MPKMREVALEQRVNKLNAIVSQQADRISELEAENAKMRELCADMFDGMCGYGHDCRDCEHYELYEGHRFVGECEYHRRVRELGIEVDG